MKPHFVIGIGSQRAGSTWLHTVLQECTDIYMHPVKELHYFDTWHGVRPPQALHKHSHTLLGADIARLVNSDDTAFAAEPRFKNHLWSNFLLWSKPVRELDYLALYQPGLAGRAWCGEVTPEYMILPEDGVQHMCSVVGADAKILLMVRNPVKRLLSALKLLNIHKKLDWTAQQAAAELAGHIQRASGWITVQDRYNDYATAIERYRRHFADVLVLRYDDIVEDPFGLALKLEQFLGYGLDLTRYGELVNQKINELGSGFELDADLLAQLQARYAAQNTFIAELFGYDCAR